MSIFGLFCPSDCDSSSSFLAYILASSPWISGRSWVLKTSSSPECLSFALQLKTYLKTQLFVDYNWDPMRNITVPEPPRLDDVSYTGVWGDIEVNDEFEARIYKVRDVVDEEQDYNTLVVVTRDVMDYYSKSENLQLIDAKGSFALSVDQFKQYAVDAGKEVVLLSVPYTDIDQALFAQAFSSLKFIEGQEWSIVSAGETYCSKFVNAIVQLLEVPGYIDHLWNEPHNTTTPKPKLITGIQPVGEWVITESESEVETRLNQCTEQLKTHNKAVFVVGPYVFQQYCQLGEGAVHLIYHQEHGLQIIEAIPLEDIIRPKKVALICVTDISEPPERVIPSLCQESLLSGETLKVIAMSNPKSLEYGQKSAVALGVKLRVEYSWDEWHSKGKTNEPARLQDAEYVGKWFAAESESEFQKRISNLLKTNFSPKIVCVTRNIMNRLTGSTNSSLAILNPTLEVPVEFSIETGNLTNYCKERLAVPASPEEKMIQSIVQKIESVLTSRDSDLVSIPTVISTLQAVLPNALNTVFSNLESKYSEAIANATKKMTEATESWKEEVKKRMADIAGKVEALRLQMENCEKTAAETKEFLQSSSVNDALNRTFLEMQNELSRVKAQFIDLHESLPKRECLVAILDLSETGELTTENKQVYSIDGADLVLKEEGKDNITLLRGVQLKPGVNKNLVEFQDECEKSFSLLWKCGETLLSSELELSISEEKTQSIMPPEIRALSSDKPMLPISMNYVDSTTIPKPSAYRSKFSFADEERARGVEDVMGVKLSDDKLQHLLSLINNPKTSAYTNDQFAKLLQ